MLKFKLSEVKPLVDHALAAQSHKPLSGGTPKPMLWIVKDAGVYLMSNGHPHLHDPAKPDEPDSSLVAYADGHDPRKGNTWDADCEECGGDDFGEELCDAAEVKRAIDEGRRFLKVAITPRQFKVTYSMR